MMFVLSGMHLSVAKHICGGEISAVKVSITDEKASCGMELAENACSNQKNFETESCCKDEISFLTVDKSYNSSTFQLIQPKDLLLQTFYIVEKSVFELNSTNLSLNINVQPPNNYIASAVSLPDICVFRI